MFSGKLLEVRRDRIRLPDGGEATREFVVHPGAVLIVPVLPDGRLVLERQFRYPVRRVMLEFPAGKIDAGESSLATGQRELAEEAGYTAEHWKSLGTIHPEIGYSTEFIDLFEATGLTHVGVAPRRGRVPRRRRDDRGRTARDVRLRRLHRRQVDRRALRVAAEPRTAVSVVARRLVVRGRVQGVGYRHAAVQAASEVGCHGLGAQSRATGRRGVRRRERRPRSKRLPRGAAAARRSHA